MPEILAFAAVFVSLTAILGILVKDARPVLGGSSDLGRLSNYSTPGEGRPWLNGLMAVVAAVTTAQWLGGSAGSAGAIGALLGAIYAVTGRLGLAGLRSVGEFVLGVVAMVPATLELTGSNSFDTDDGFPRLLLAGIVFVVYVVTVGMSLILHLFRLPPLGSTVLGIFGAIESLNFAVAPLGVPIGSLSAAGLLVGVVAAFLLGLATVSAPRLVIGLTVIAITLTEAGFGAVYGSYTQPGLDSTLLTGMATFSLVHLLVSRVFRGRH